MLFRELKSEMSVDKSLVHQWEHLRIGTWDNIRLYYKPIDDGFMFYVFDFISCSGSDGSVYDQPDVEVEIMFCGYGFFDGIRHLYMHKDDVVGGFDGYIYYPKVAAMVEIFSKLRELELKYCSSPDEGY